MTNSHSELCLLKKIVERNKKNPMIRLFTPAESISFKVQIFKVNKKNSLWVYKKNQNALWDV